MITYNFEETPHGAIRQYVNGIYQRSFIGSSLIEVAFDNSFYIVDENNNRHRYDVNGNVFQLNGVAITGIVSDICKALDEVFPDTNTGSGGTGTPATSLNEVTDGTARFAMNTEQRDFLNALMGIDNP